VLDVCLLSSFASGRLDVCLLASFASGRLDVCPLASFASGRLEVSFLPRSLFSCKPVEQVPEAFFLSGSSIEVLPEASLIVCDASSGVAILF
jgi:hypothetical protein